MFHDVYDALLGCIWRKNLHGIYVGFLGSHPRYRECRHRYRISILRAASCSVTIRYTFKATNRMLRVYLELTPILNPS